MQPKDIEPPQLEIADWQPVRDALQFAYESLGLHKIKNSGGEHYHSLHWNLAVKIYEFLKQKLQGKCHTCGEAFSPQYLYRCADCKMLFCEWCIKEHFPEEWESKVALQKEVERLTQELAAYEAMLAKITSCYGAWRSLQVQKHRESEKRGEVLIMNADVEDLRREFYLSVEQCNFTAEYLDQLLQQERDKALEKADADAELARWMLSNCAWHRDGELGDYIAVYVPKGSDLSCYAMRHAAIRAAIKDKSDTK